MNTITHLIWRSIRNRLAGESDLHLLPKKEKVDDSDEMICRVCTNVAETPITDKIGKMTIISAIGMVANVWISPNDLFPKFICENCVDELKVAVAFKRKCEMSEWKFRFQTPRLPVVAPQMGHTDFSAILRKMRARRERERSNTTYDVFINESSDSMSISNDSIGHISGRSSRDSSMDRPLQELKKSMVLSPEHVTIRESPVFEDNPPTPIKLESPDRSLTNSPVMPVKKRSVKKRGRIPKKPLKKKEKKPFRYKCKRCGETFDTKELRTEHVKGNCVIPPCPLCGKVITKLYRHMKIVHMRAEKYACHVCGKVIYTSHGLKKHLLIHSDKYEFACHLCPYKGKQQAYLTAHMRIHTGEKPYLCSQCPATFTNQSNLRKHQLVHGNKKFECDKCKKQFRHQQTLKEHYEAAHLNIRYHCSICGRDMITRKKLLKHELRVHNREKHKLFEDVYKVVVPEEHQ